MPIYVEDTIADLDALNVRISAATKQSVADVLHMFQASAMEKAPVGTPGNTTNAPGDLSRSIEVTGPDGSDGSYNGLVGPTTVYGRQRELGGHIFPVYATRLRFEKFGEVVHTFHVYQVPEPYLLPAEEENLVNVLPIAEARIAEALATG